MELWRLESPRRLRWAAFLALVSLAIAVGCEREDPPAIDTNRAPETYLTQGPEVSDDPEDPTDLYYRSHLFWRGEDFDGTIVGFEFAIDDTSDSTAWTWTAKSDSVFRFSASEVGAVEHRFWVRAVDNLGKRDPTPKELFFEAFTTAAPRVSINSVLVNGQPSTIESGDTVRVFSDVQVCWSGTDDDGEVVGWETQFDGGGWTPAALEDNCRQESSLDSRQHTFSVRAIDDAGARSTDVARFKVTSNFDPVTTIDSTSIVAKLARPWIAPDDTLEVRYLNGGVVQDTMPLHSILSFNWSSTDIDGPVESWNWKVQQQSAFTTVTSTVVPLPLGPSTTDGQAPAKIEVRATDFYGRTEGRPPTIDIQVNYRPEVTVPSDTMEFFAPQLVSLGFSGDDRDGDPANLLYRWQFDDEGSPSSPTSFHPDSLFITRFYAPSEEGLHHLTIWAQDESEFRRESNPARRYFRITDSTSAR